jgi:hypothetical protein
VVTAARGGTPRIRTPGGRAQCLATLSALVEHRHELGVDLRLGSQSGRDLDRQHILGWHVAPKADFRPLALASLSTKAAHEQGLRDVGPGGLEPPTYRL